MTKSKQKTATQRFSGPELGELLDQVVTELGPSAEISEVNKIRSGGVAGFFCREEYEIVVDPGSPNRATIAAETAAASAAETAGASAGQIAGDEIADDDRIDAGPDGASEVVGGSRPRTVEGTDERFLALLERRLDETSEAESHLATRRARRPAPKPTTRLAHPDVEEHAAIEDVTQAPRPASPVSSAPAPPQNRRRPAGFWARISRAGRQLTDVCPEPSPFVAIIGPLSLTTPVIKRLRTDTELANAEVIVLTDRAEIVSEPNWRLVRSGHQLIDVANERNGEPTLLVLDVPVDLPQWVAPLQQRLRLAGVGAFRYAVPGTPSVEQLDRYRLGSDVPYVLDLVSRVEPDRLVSFVDQQHPIGSVGGAALTAELLVAMQEQVGLGR